MKTEWFHVKVSIIIALLYFALGVYVSMEFARYKCDDKGFIQIFDSGYYCNKSSRTYGYDINPPTREI